MNTYANTVAIIQLLNMIFLKILYNKKRLYLVIGEKEVDCLFVMYLAAVVVDDTS